MKYNHVKGMGTDNGSLRRQDRKHRPSRTGPVQTRTGRKLADEALRESEERLNRSQEIAHLGSWELDLEDDILTWSDEVYRIFGLQPREFGATYEAFLERVHPDDRAAVDAAYSGSIREGKDTYEIEHRVVRKDTGEIRYVHEKCRHFRDKNGVIIRSVGMVHDITERKLAEDALRQSEERFRLLFERAGDAIFLLQAEGVEAGRILAANKAAADMHGYTVQDMLSMKITDLDTADAARGSPELVERILRGEWIKTEITHHRKDGRIFPVEISAGLLEYGGQKYILALDRDITERKRAEKEINELNKELACNLHELDAANKELEAFIYSVSHDLRAPLRSIAGFSDILLQDCSDKLDDKGKKYLNWVINGAAKMNEIIDDLLHLSRISRHEVECENVNMSKIVQSIIAELRESQPERRVSIDIRNGIVVRADPGLIEVALSNLLRNAWKFTSKKDNARIEFGTFEREGQTVYFVKDTGAGFDQNRTGRLFLPFQRLHPEQEFEGSGVGLAIVERVVRRHGGKIWAEGRSNEGAAFFFTLTEERECRP